VDGIAFIALNGLALGLASTLHCAGMCGGIACGLLLAQERGSSRDARVAFALTHVGRVGAYALAGAFIGIVGAPAVGWLDRDAAFRLLQWAAAASLIWVGLSTAGMLPSLTLLDRGLGSVAGGVARLNAAAQSRVYAPLLSGLAWGMMPCAMVYAALFTAMLTGSGWGGATTMAAFGIGTLPGLLAAAFGFRHLAGVARSRPRRIAAGLTVALFGVVTILIAHPHIALLCLPGQAASHPRSLKAVDRHQTELRAATLGLGSRANGTPVYSGGDLRSP
jgi:sulfite exporter TauE/SafE